MIAFSATNPCHMYEMALALHARRMLRAYYSGYPGWRLRPPPDFPLQTFPFRTVITYGLLRLPLALRPADKRLFRWQDYNFDRDVAANLPEGEGDFIHALPGQSLRTFAAARSRGWRTVLNHASGPVRQQLDALREEYLRIGLDHSDYHHFDTAYFENEKAEYAAADYHCVASTIVRAQLRAEGVAAEKIWVVPYAADPAIFHPPVHRPANPLRVVFAGQLTVRKGIRILLAAARKVRASLPIELHCYGRIQADIGPDLAGVEHESWIHLHGPLPKRQLAAAFQEAHLLVLPSWEEAFGLVVPQALNCGVPCIVSSRVGASDLVQSRVNGSVFPVGNVEALATEMSWWLRNQTAFHFRPLEWAAPAEQLLSFTRAQAST